MSDVRISEQCSCGARIEVVGGAYRRDLDPRNPRGAEEIVERWRADHKHETPVPEPPEPERPAIYDVSSAQVERSHEQTQLLGFQASERRETT